MRISFCTTCANRLHQFRTTFDANRELISRHPETEWVILNYNSKDELHEFVMERLPELPARIVYARDSSGNPWHLSVAKNIAHRLASGDVLFNLDCDNFIGDGIDQIKRLFSDGAQIAHLWSGTFRDGTCGRVALTRTLFYALGGYDESFYPMGYQDRDLINRASASGFRVVTSHCPPDFALPNSKQEATINCVSDAGKDWELYNRKNREKSLANVKAQRLTANAENAWAKLQVELWKGKCGG